MSTSSGVVRTLGYIATLALTLSATLAIYSVSEARSVISWLSSEKKGRG